MVAPEEFFVNGVPLPDHERHLATARDFLPDLLSTIRAENSTVPQICEMLQKMIDSGELAFPWYFPGKSIRPNRARL